MAGLANLIVNLMKFDGGEGELKFAPGKKSAGKDGRSWLIDDQTNAHLRLPALFIA
jgi:hypothetical protein